MTLERKAETAIIAHLKGDSNLAALGFTHHQSEEIKDGQIVVSVTRGAEVTPPSGVYKLQASVSLRLRLRRFGDTADRTDELATRLERLLSEPKLNLHFTANCPDFHCYHASLESTDRDPIDGKTFHHLFTLTLEAMPTNYATAEKLSTRNFQHTTA